ncbi:MAG: ankyrin repeat domain-containing protein, partial [Pseudomonadota bacterium]|nr:ankyrin repeat domain-containing protein [Pseudomonadota bacterium]
MKHLLLTTIAAVVLTTTAFADPIHDAAKAGDSAGVQAELDKGVDPNAKGGDSGVPPLHWAAMWGHTEVVEVLIASGAYVDRTDNGGNIALHYAALGAGFPKTKRGDQKGVAELLIANGANVNVRRIDGKT